VGYYTYYALKVHPEQGDDDQAHKEAIASNAGYTSAHLWEDSTKWYEYEDIMREYSMLHPELTFVLDGDGEQSGDIWRMWFKNGKHRRWDANVERPAEPEEPL
jgi:hypothetical protein